MNKTIKIAVLLVILFVLGIGSYLAFSYLNKTPVADPEMSVEPEKKFDLIYLETPLPNETISSPLTISGQARGTWFFEADFPIKIYDDNGQFLGTAVAQADGDWMTEEFVPFQAELDFNYSMSTSGVLVLEKDNPSGLPEYDDELRVPVKFSASPETMKIKVFFNNNKLDPDFSCNKVFPVEREITKTVAVARAALNELLAGTTPEEEADGFAKILGSDIKIQSLMIEDGVAKVDFNEALEAGSGGSCRSAAIIAQINATLKQFSTVTDVIISVNGRTEDILQP